MCNFTFLSKTDMDDPESNHILNFSLQTTFKELLKTKLVSESQFKALQDNFKLSLESTVFDYLSAGFKNEAVAQIAIELATSMTLEEIIDDIRATADIMINCEKKLMNPAPELKKILDDAARRLSFNLAEGMIKLGLVEGVGFQEGNKLRH